MRNSVSVFVILMVVAFSCTPPPDPPEPKLEDNWTYLYTNYDTGGVVIYQYTIFLVAHSSGYNDSWVTLADTFGGSNLYVPYGRYRLNTDGLHATLWSPTLTTSTLFLKYPGASGEIYPMHHGNNAHVDITIDSNNDTVTVPFGFFDDANQYHFFNSSHTDQIWFNDSVWFIKYNRLDSLPSGLGTYLNYSYELVDYEMH
jgi:hypothetical protein